MRNVVLNAGDVDSEVVAGFGWAIAMSIGIPVVGENLEFMSEKSKKRSK